MGNKQKPFSGSQRKHQKIGRYLAYMRLLSRQRRSVTQNTFGIEGTSASVISQPDTIMQKDYGDEMPTKMLVTTTVQPVQLFEISSTTKRPKDYHDEMPTKMLVTTTVQPVQLFEISSTTKKPKDYHDEMPTTRLVTTTVQPVQLFEISPTIVSQTEKEDNPMTTMELFPSTTQQPESFSASSTSRLSFVFRINLICLVTLYLF